MRKAPELFRVEPEVFRIGVDKVTEHRENVPGLPEMFREVPGGSRGLMEVSGGLGNSPGRGNRV
jgi:hypothetical protein